jgi:hypothetical protein
MPKATVGLDIDINSNSIATATRRSDDLVRSTDRLTRGLRGLGAGVAVVGAAVAAAAGGLLVMTKRIADQSDEIAKNSTRLGLSAEAYQEFAHAIELSGGTISEVDAGLRKLSANMLDVSQGSATAAQAFSDIGVDALTSTGQLRSLDSVLADIADEFANMEDGPEKSARAMELFGRAGTRLIPLLNAGSEGIAEMRQEAQELGLVISSDTARAAEALNDDITRLRGIAQGFANDIASRLIPRLRDVADDVERFARNVRRGNVDVGRLASEGLEALIAGMRLVATASVRTVQGLLFLQRQTLLARNELVSWFDTLERVGSNLPIPQMQLMAAAIRRMGLEEIDFTERISGIDETVSDLETLHGHIQRIGQNGPARAAVRQLEDDIIAMTNAMFGLDNAPDPDPDPRPTREATEALDKYSLAAKNASRAVAELNTHNEQVAAGMTRLFSEFRAAQAELAESKALEESIQAKDAAILDYEKRLLELSETVDKSAEDMSGKFGQLASLGKSAFSGLTSAISQLSLAAFFRKDGNALKEFGKSLGQMLVQLGTMAVVYAGVAALGAVFPALQPLVGPAAAAPALAAAGAVAIAAGAALGAATGGGGRGPGRGRDEGGGTQAVETSRTTIYNVQLGAGMSRRGMNRTLIEQVGSAVEQGV